MTEQGRATRERNLEAQRKLWTEKAEAISAARIALTKLMERDDTTSAEILRAAELLVEMGRGGK